MNIFNTVLLAFILASSSMVQANKAEPEKPSIAKQHAEVFFQRPRYSSVRSDPSGQRVSFIEHKGKKQSLLMLELASNDMHILYIDNNEKMRGHYWADPNTLVIALNYKDYRHSLFKFELVFEQGKLKDIQESLILNRAYMLDPLPDQENQIVVEYDNQEEWSVYKLDLSARNISGQLGARRKLDRLAPDADSWLLDNSGELRIGIETEEGKTTIWHKTADKGRWQELWNHGTETIFTPVLYKSETQELYVLSNYQRNFVELVSYDLKKKTFGDTVFSVTGHDISHAEPNQQGDGILYVSYTENGVTSRRYLAEFDTYLGQTLNKIIKTKNIWLADSSINNELVIAVKSNSKQPGIYYLYESEKGQMSELTATQPWINQFKLGRDQVIQSTSSDKLNIESYLTLPANSNTTKPPLIVIPHGGPVSVRSYREYSPEVQYLSTLGYAVLRPNYRGSSGYGKAFKDAAKQQWGQLIEDDIASAVQTVIDAELVDKDKVCIFGASYGGYSALMSAIRKPNMYQCAASYVGVTDLSLMFSNDDSNYDKGVLNWRKEYVGDPKLQLKRMIANSPVYQAQRLRVPVFLAQGGKDGVVDSDHYYRMRDMLNAHNKDAEFLFLENEEHTVQEHSSMWQLYSRLDSFFRKHLDLPPPTPLRQAP